MTQIQWPFETPEPGIYFGMSFEDYLAIPALQSSSLKQLLLGDTPEDGAMDFWARSWMNPLKEEEDKEAAHFLDGRAYHARILEGKKVFDKEYTSDYEVPTGMEVLKNNKEMMAYLKNNGVKGYSSKTAPELCNLLKEIPSHTPALYALEEAHKIKHSGKEFIKPKVMREIELGARMIEHHPHLKSWFVGGYPEVTVIWDCPKTGARNKARFDYMKVGPPVDLKTFANQMGKSYRKCIIDTIARYKYYIQGAYYILARDFAAQHVRDGKVFGADTQRIDPEWLKAMSTTQNDEFWWVFQQKGIAPVAIGRKFRRDEGACASGLREIERGTHIFCENLKIYGTDGAFINRAAPEFVTAQDFPAWAFD